MGVSVYDREGPYFTSGEIKWSQLRNTFKEVNSGTINALSLKRNTDGNARDPIVPDCVANEDIAGWNFSSGTGDSNWKASQMRDSYKRFWARQTGTDVNFKMGRYNGSEGIDWGGYGSGGRDSTSSGNGNLTKNIQKYIKIEGTCGANDSGSWGGENNDPGAGSWNPGAPAAQLNPTVPARNVRIWVYGSILGAGGEGGYDSRGYDHSSGTQNGADPGTPGGTALSINHSGNDTWVTIKSGSARIYGGGGGGEQGMNGAIPQQGTCSRTWTTSGCGSAPACSPSNGGTVETTGSWSGGCCSWGEYCWTRWPFSSFCNEYCVANTQGNNCKETINSTRPTQGIGGRGGNGKGYNMSQTSGQNGTDPSPKCPTCSVGGYTYNSDGTCTDAGRRGGDGGDWGQDGQDTSANNAMHAPQPSTGGDGGSAVCGSPFTLSGTINNNTVKGSYSGGCPGTTVVTNNPTAPSVSVSSSGSGPYNISWSASSPWTITNVFGQSTPSDSGWNPTSNSGTFVANPSITTTYKVFAQNAGGTGSNQVTVGGNAATWTMTRAASWQNRATFNKYEGTGQSQIVVTENNDQSSNTVSVTASTGAKYRLTHASGSQSTNWYDGSNGVTNLSEPNGQAQSPVFKLDGNQKVRIEDGSSNTEHSDARSWIDLIIQVSAGTFSVDGHTDWPIHIDGLHSDNDGRTTWLQNGTNDQRIELWDGDGQDANASFEIISKDSSITEAKFVDGGRKLRIKGGGNITLKAGWNDNPGTAGVAFNYIELWNVRWTRSGQSGSSEKTYATCGGDIIYQR